MLLSLSFSELKSCRLHLISAMFLCFLFLGCIGTAKAATQHLMCSPLRLIFTERQRAITAHVINQGDKTITYSIALITLRKAADGRMYEPKDKTPEELMIKKLIRFSPRRATIGPRQSQIVKLMVRKPKDLSPGEYRIFIQLHPHPSTERTRKRVAGVESGMGVNVELTVDSNFPVIIQHQVPMGTVSPSSAQLHTSLNRQDVPKLELTLTREGKASAFGNIFLDYIAPEKSAQPVEIGRVIDMALYAPEKRKVLTVPLKTDIPVQQLKRGKIRVSFQPSTGKTKRRHKAAGQVVSKEFSLQ